ncbi:MAG: TolB family protein, partial [Bacteroidota bacterium]
MPFDAGQIIYVAVPAKGVIRLQKGHRPSTAPILLILLVASAVMACATGAFAQKSYIGGLIPINGLNNNDPAARPIIGRNLPTPPIMMYPKQGSGPNPDTNLTPTASVSQEFAPFASPGPSQNRIVFVSNGSDGNGVTNPPDGAIDPVAPAADADFDIWIMRSDGSEQYRLVDLPGDQIDPQYDPSGRLVVFSSRINNVWQIFTCEIRDPSIVKQITTGPGNKRHPTWSPDSNWIAFQNDLNGTWDLYKIIATGAGQPISLTSGPANDTDPAWSPLGGLIAFSRESAGMSRIWVTDPEALDIQQLSEAGGNPQANDREPCWRQNGTALAFSSNRFSDPADTIPNYNIWTMTSVGETNGAPVTIVSDTDLTSSRDNVNPTWTVDIDRAPSRIVFTSYRAGNQPDLWAMQLRDWTPPVLGYYSNGVLTSQLPSVTPRLATPGQDVTISVPVYDGDSGVKMVIARIRDADVKNFYYTSGDHFDGSFPDGQRALEWINNSLEPPFAAATLLPMTDDDGDGVFTVVWTTPAIASGRDYIIDIEVVDNAAVPNALRYDSVYGFTTRMFAPKYNILFVDDYCE